MSLIFNNSPFFDLLDVFDRQLSKNSNFNAGNFDLVPPVDMVEKEKSYELRASLPGADAANITIDFNKEINELKVAGTIPEHKIEEEDSENHKYYKEIRTGSFERSVRFPKKTPINEDGITASYKNGVLEVTVPKAEPKEPQSNVRRIKVRGLNESAKEEATEKSA